MERASLDARRVDGGVDAVDEEGSSGWMNFDDLWITKDLTMRLSLKEFSAR